MPPTPPPGASPGFFCSGQRLLAGQVLLISFLLYADPIIVGANETAAQGTNLRAHLFAGCVEPVTHVDDL